jgi:hypothetical protein
MPTQNYFECSLTLENATQAKLTTQDDKSYTGNPTLTEETLQRLEAQRDSTKEYGATLFNALFSDGLLTGYRNALNTAGTRKLRLRFEIPDNAPDANKLSQLNWELLYDTKAAKGEDFLSSSADIVFSRQRNIAGLLAGLGTPDTLKLLVVLSCPNNLNDNYETLDRVQLKARFDDALTPLSGRVTYEFLSQATRDDIRDKVRDGGYDGVQFYGHGYRDRSTNETGLILEKADGSADFVAEETCLDLFKGKELRLLCLMACYSGTMKNDDDPFSGLALRLVRQNHQAVIAMKRAIKITTADAFLKYFYKYLKSFDGVVDAAVGEAWLQLSINGDDEWSIPTLYMRLTDGRLWKERQGGTTPLPATNATGAIKDGIVNYFRKGKVIPIIGPGILKEVLPSPAEIGQYLADKYNYPADLRQSQYNDLPRVARFIGIQQGLYFPHEQVIDYLKEQLLERKGKNLEQWGKKSLSDVINNIAADHFVPDEPHKILAELGLKTYITTNWDSFMCAALTEAGHDPLRVRCKWKTNVKQDYDVSSPEKPLVYHIYGADDEPTSMVLTEDDYLEFIRNISIDWKQIVTENERPRIPHYVQRELGSCMLLFLGFNLRDLDFRILFKGLVERVEGGDDVDPKRMAVVQLDDATTTEEIRQFIRNDANKMNIEVFPGSVKDFLVDIRTQLNGGGNAQP